MGSSINVLVLKAGLHTVFIKLVDDVNYVDVTSDILTVNVAKVTLNISAIASDVRCHRKILLLCWRILHQMINHLLCL